MIRIISIALGFLALTLVLLPFQLIGMAFDLRLQRTIPHLYHRVLCALIGVRIREVGRRSAESPALILARHMRDISAGAGGVRRQERGRAMAGVRLACKTAANDLHQPAGPASDRR